MSFEPITCWALRCDGNTARGRCTELLACDPDSDPDEPDPTPGPAVFHRQVLDSDDHSFLRHTAGWLALRDGRHLCRAHVAGLEHLAHAALDGLPFDTPPTDSLPIETEDIR